MQLNTGWKSQIFGTTPLFGGPVEDDPIEISQSVSSLLGKLEWWGHQVMKKFDGKFSRFDTNVTWTVTDRRTLQWPHYSKGRAMDSVVARYKIAAFSDYAVCFKMFVSVILYS